MSILSRLWSLVPDPFKIWAIVIAVGVLLGVGSVAGWKARDYLADRKELSALKAQLKKSEANAADWAKQAKDHAATEANAQTIAAQRQKERDESMAKATDLAAQVLTLKGRLTRMEVQNVSAEGVCMCERTDPCHWLLINAATDGTQVPEQCAGSVPAQVKGKLLPHADMDRAGN